MASNVGIPHFSYPFRFKADGHAAVNEQDTEEDIIDCTIALLKCPLGFRDELPDFGVRDNLFTEGDLDLNEIRIALEMWEERAIYTVLEDKVTLDNLVRLLKVQVEARNA